MKRRTLLKSSTLAAFSPLALAACHGPQKSTGHRPFQPRNQDFYTGGKFDEEKAKQGVIDLCRSFGYPIYPNLREKLWVSDYGTGQFMKVGLAACMFVNHHGPAGTYMLMDLFLMPNQMLPEHWHTAGDHNITKDEGWLIRYGTSYIGGIGPDNLDQFPHVKIPSCHFGGKVTTRHCLRADAGQFVPLAQPTSRHWQFAGPRGCILTEVANFHTDRTTFHTDPAINKHFLGA